MDKKLKSKSLCKWKREEVNKNSAELVAFLSHSKYFCERCLRSSRLRGTLCKPEKLDRMAG